MVGLRHRWISVADRHQQLATLRLSHLTADITYSIRYGCQDEDLFGTVVNEAARITATAKGGEILVSNVVRELAKGKDFLFADRGEASLKGFDESVWLYELRWGEE